MYQLRNVTKTCTNGHCIVPAVEWLAIQGRTGSGKATAPQPLGGLDRPTADAVNLDGHDLA